MAGSSENCCNRICFSAADAMKFFVPIRPSPHVVCGSYAVDAISEGLKLFQMTDSSEKSGGSTCDLSHMSLGSEPEPSASKKHRQSPATHHEEKKGNQASKSEGKKDWNGFKWSRGQKHCLEDEIHAELYDQKLCHAREDISSSSSASMRLKMDQGSAKAKKSISALKVSRGLKPSASPTLSSASFQSANIVLDKKSTGEDRNRIARQSSLQKYRHESAEKAKNTFNDSHDIKKGHVLQSNHRKTKDERERQEYSREVHETSNRMETHGEHHHVHRHKDEPIREQFQATDLDGGWDSNQKVNKETSRYGHSKGEEEKFKEDVSKIEKEYGRKQITKFETASYSSRNRNKEHNDSARNNKKQTSGSAKMEGRSADYERGHSSYPDKVSESGRSQRIPQHSLEEATRGRYRQSIDNHGRQTFEMRGVKNRADSYERGQLTYHEATRKSEEVIGTRITQPSQMLLKEHDDGWGNGTIERKGCPLYFDVEEGTIPSTAEGCEEVSEKKEAHQVSQKTKERKKVKTMWAATRVIFYDDDSRTYEVMKMTNNFPKGMSMEVDGIFAMAPPEIRTIKPK